MEQLPLPSHVVLRKTANGRVQYVDRHTGRLLANRPVADDTSMHFGQRAGSFSSPRVPEQVRARAAKWDQMVAGAARKPQPAARRPSAESVSAAAARAAEAVMRRLQSRSTGTAADDTSVTAETDSATTSSAAAAAPSASLRAAAKQLSWQSAARLSAATNGDAAALPPPPPPPPPASRPTAAPVFISVPAQPVAMVASSVAGRAVDSARAHAGASAGAEEEVPAAAGEERGGEVEGSDEGNDDDWQGPAWLNGDHDDMRPPLPPPPPPTTPAAVLRPHAATADRPSAVGSGQLSAGLPAPPPPPPAAAAASAAAAAPVSPSLGGIAYAFCERRPIVASPGGARAVGVRPRVTAVLRAIGRLRAERERQRAAQKLAPPPPPAQLAPDPAHPVRLYERPWLDSGSVRSARGARSAGSPGGAPGERALHGASTATSDADWHSKPGMQGFLQRSAEARRKRELQRLRSQRTWHEGMRAAEAEAEGPGWDASTQVRNVQPWLRHQVLQRRPAPPSPETSLASASTRSTAALARLRDSRETGLLARLLQPEVQRRLCGHPGAEDGEGNAGEGGAGGEGDAHSDSEPARLLRHASAPALVTATRAVRAVALPSHASDELARAVRALMEHAPSGSGSNSGSGSGSEGEARKAALRVASPRTHGKYRRRAPLRADLAVAQ